MIHAVTEEWRRLYNEELCDVLLSPNVVGDQSKENEMGGTCSMYEKRRVAYRNLMGGVREGDHMEDSGIDWRKILKWALKKWDGRHGLA
jgi:hypothetical protein